MARMDYRRRDVPMHRENRNTEISRLAVKARITLDSTTAGDSEKMDAAVFLRGVGES